MVTPSTFAEVPEPEEADTAEDDEEVDEEEDDDEGDNDDEEDEDASSPACTKPEAFGSFCDQVISCTILATSRLKLHGFTI